MREDIYCSLLLCLLERRFPIGKNMKQAIGHGKKYQKELAKGCPKKGCPMRHTCWNRCQVPKIQVYRYWKELQNILRDYLKNF